MTSCCSEGYCTHDIVCQGNKVVGDNCDTNEECISSFCFNNECQVKAIMFPVWMWILIISITCAAVIVLTIAFFCLRNRNRTKSDLGSELEKYVDMHDRREPFIRKNAGNTPHELI
jgi:hypothetical protein